MGCGSSTAKQAGPESPLEGKYMSNDMKKYSILSKPKAKGLFIKFDGTSSKAFIPIQIDRNQITVNAGKIQVGTTYNDGVTTYWTTGKYHYRNHEDYRPQSPTAINVDDYCFFISKNDMLLGQVMEFDVKESRYTLRRCHPLDPTKDHWDTNDKNRYALGGRGLMVSFDEAKLKMMLPNLPKPEAFPEDTVAATVVAPHMQICMVDATYPREPKEAPKVLFGIITPGVTENTSPWTTGSPLHNTSWDVVYRVEPEWGVTLKCIDGQLEGRTIEWKPVPGKDIWRLTEVVADEELNFDIVHAEKQKAEPYGCLTGSGRHLVVSRQDSVLLDFKAKDAAHDEEVYEPRHVSTHLNLVDTKHIAPSNFPLKGTVWQRSVEASPGVVTELKTGAPIGFYYGSVPVEMVTSLCVLFGPSRTRLDELLTDTKGTTWDHELV